MLPGLGTAKFNPLEQFVGKRVCIETLQANCFGVLTKVIDDWVLFRDKYWMNVSNIIAIYECSDQESN